MNFNLKAPCGKMCPFSTNCLKGWLGNPRASEIAHSLVKLDQTFPCHKTVDYDQEDEDDERPYNPKEEHCAGALIMLEKMENPNQMMRIAERIGFYNRFELKMDSPVFYDDSDFISHHSK